MKVWVLEIEDEGDFHRTKEFSIWSSAAGAMRRSDERVAELIAKNPEWGDTYAVKISEEEVRV